MLRRPCRRPAYSRCARRDGPRLLGRAVGSRSRGGRPAAAGPGSRRGRSSGSQLSLRQSLPGDQRTDGSGVGYVPGGRNRRDRRRGGGGCASGRPGGERAGDRDSHPRHGGDPRRGPPRRSARQRGGAVHPAPGAYRRDRRISGGERDLDRADLVADRGGARRSAPQRQGPRRRPQGEPAGLESRQWHVRGGAESHLAVLLRARAPSGWPRVLRRGPHQRQSRAAGSHAVLAHRQQLVHQQPHGSRALVSHGDRDGQR